MCARFISALFVLSILLATSAGVCAVEFPGAAPGKATASLEGHRLMMENAILSATWTLGPGRIQLERFSEKLGGASIGFSVLELGGAGNNLVPAGPPRLDRLSAAGRTAGRGEGESGWAAVLPLRSADGAIEVELRILLRDQANYLRQEWRIRSAKPLAAGEIPTLDRVLWAGPLAGAAVAGKVDGSPVVVGRVFFGWEHPMARASVRDGMAQCAASPARALLPGETLRRSGVVGVAPEGQLRRAFLYYLERERPRPYAPFLHYNSWYDIAWHDRKMDEGQCLAVIDSFAREFVAKRKGKLDSLVFDDGWDDNRTLWRFHGGFPRGFTPLTEAAARHGMALGVWLSPWGGYASAKEERLKYGQTQGFETNSRGFSLAGPKYYARFREACSEMIARYGVNYFKFDGISQGADNSGAVVETAGDVEGLLRLIGDLRSQRPDVFINVTTGTWPSPFWLLWCDSTWRNGDDMGFFGPGSKRQQWITYRDMITYRSIVLRAPCYPLNSLMNQGIAHARVGRAAELGEDLKEFADEVQSFFGTGTQTQELYVTPQKLSAPMWDLLAEGAAWSRRNADVLADAHWIGGDPGKGEAYGIAAWGQRGGTISLRNPRPEPASIAIDPARAFELPPGAPRQYRLTSPWKGRPRAAQTVRAGEETVFRLAPFEVLVLEATPEG